MRTETEIGIMSPKTRNVKGCQELPEARREAWNGLSLRTSRGNMALLTP